MNLFRCLRAVTTASGDGVVDWTAATDAAKAATPPGSIDMSPAERSGYADDVRDARNAVRDATGLAFDVPRTVEIQNRHHWIDANVETFRRVMAPLEDQPVMFPGAARVVNTGTMATFLSFLGRNVLGQYDPLLLADGDVSDDHRLYFVRPNIVDVADELDVDYDRFRRWIAFHEVTHAAEFGQAPWLADHLEARMEDGIRALSAGQIDRTAFRELDATMTAVEGYAELLMDRTFDDEADDLREKLDARRRNRGPIAMFLNRVLGLGLKRRQYERGKAFFEFVTDARGLPAASAVWDAPDALPTGEEFDDPSAWLARVDP